MKEPINVGNSLMAWNNSPLGENGEFLVSMVLMEALTTFWDVKVAKGSQNNWYFGCYNQKRENNGYKFICFGSLGAR